MHKLKLLYFNWNLWADFKTSHTIISATSVFRLIHFVHKMVYFWWEFCYSLHIDSHTHSPFATIAFAWKNNDWWNIYRSIKSEAITPNMLCVCDVNNKQCINISSTSTLDIIFFFFFGTIRFGAPIYVCVRSSLTDLIVLTKRNELSGKAFIKIYCMHILHSSVLTLLRW